MAIGAQISRRLKAIGWTQSQLARVADLPQSTVNSIVRNDPRMTPHLARIAKALGISPSDLTGEGDFADSGLPAFTPAEVAWVEIFRGLDERSRSSLLHVGQLMLAGLQAASDPALPEYKGNNE